MVYLLLIGLGRGKVVRRSWDLKEVYAFIAPFLNLSTHAVEDFICDFVMFYNFAFHLDNFVFVHTPVNVAFLMEVQLKKVNCGRFFHGGTWAVGVDMYRHFGSE